MEYLYRCDLKSLAISLMKLKRLYTQFLRIMHNCYSQQKVKGSRAHMHTFLIQIETNDLAPD